MRKVLKRNVAIIMLITMLLSIFSNIVNATEISSAYLTNCGDCGRHLMYWKDEIEDWSYVITTFVAYNENGVQYPAYCLDKDVNGVGEQGDYTVNINRVLDDDRIWRVAINGYPYQSPSSMGVANEDDAFVATKQAVYCILYGWDAESRYNGADDRGDAIKNALVNLVNIGRYGTQTRANTDININKAGEFFEDGDYYSQSYRVDSPLDTAEYTIIATANLPEGSVVTDLNNNAKSTFAGNEQFKIKVPKNQLGTDVNGTVVIKAKCKTYPVFYGETSIPGTQDYAVTFDPYGDISGQTDLNVKTNTGKIQINKLDDETSQPIEGVTFGLYLGETEVGQATTDENGIATFENLYQNNYTLKELETNEKYILNDTPFDVRVEYNKTSVQDIENENIKGQIEITKKSSNDNKITGEKKGTPLEGAKFEIYNSNNELVDTLITDKEGKAISGLLVKGEYQLKEVDSGSKYYLINTGIFKTEIKEHKEIVKVNVEDDSVDVDVEVKKKGFVETQSKDSIYYDFSNVHNKSNVALNNFTWSDSLPTNALRANRIYTGTWNEDLKYSIWYKTNLRDDYIMLQDNLSTTTNNEVKFTDIALQEGEFITDFEFRFGTVKADFREIEQPRLYCDMLDNLPNGFVFVNHTKVSGNYEDVYVEDTDDWKTITYYKEIELSQNLPKTGGPMFRFKKNVKRCLDIYYLYL